MDDTLLLFHSWRKLMSSPYYEIGLAIAAVICGAIVGSERQKREKPAGLRTLVLVSIGSAAFTMLSFVFSTSTGDSGRVVAQIVTGIGFLGAGVIMHGRSSIITGATTAAMIWATAAIGAIVGAGYPLGGLGLSVLIRLVLYILNIMEARETRMIPTFPAVIDFDPDHGKTRIRLDRIMGDFGVPQSAIQWTPLSDGSGLVQLSLQLRLHAHHLLEMLDEIVSEPAVKAVRNLPEEAVEAKPKPVF